MLTPDSPFLYVEPWAAGCGGSTLSATLIGEYGKMYKIAPVVQEYGSSQFNTVIRSRGDSVMPNPFVCNIDSYLNYGNVARETCNCPVWEYTKLYEEMDYIRMGAGYCLPDTGKVGGKSLQQCKDLCTADPLCDAFSFYDIDGECIISQNGCNDDGEFGINNFRWVRYKFSVTEASKNRCCKTGERIAYSVPIDNSRANLHSCLQNCTFSKDATARISFTDKFHCHCGDAVYTESSCIAFESDCDSSQYQLRLEATSSKEVCRCSGSYISEGNLYSCPVNTFMPTDSSCRSFCYDCEFGKFSQSGSTRCEDCLAGKVIDSSNRCTECPDGKYSNSGDLFCSTCTPGKYSNKGSSQCVICPLGFHAPASGSVYCLQCPRGYISSNGAGSVSCTECGTGTYTIYGIQAECTECAAGKYSAETKQSDESTCKQCNSGYISSAGSASCTPCGKGKKAAANNLKCNNCDEGSYQDQTGQTSW